MNSNARENAALVREFLTEVLAGGDLEALDIFLTDCAVDHHPASTGDEAGGPSERDGICRILGAADVEIDVEDVVAEGDLVAIRGTVRGSHQASLVDPTATGRTFEISYAWFCRIADGQIAEIWSIPDGRGLYRELGISSAQSSPKETRAE